MFREIQQQMPHNKLKWTGSIIEWVELIYALRFVKRINSGKISLKELFQQMGEIFDFEVKEFANYFMNIKNRTNGSRTKFMDLMKDVLLGLMNDADRKPSRK
ncbi:MAG: RteC domain-containing protein [Prevotellaceae bacterium]|nr:RteC domain-containing protein [Prevotellaceae bacterium]